MNLNEGAPGPWNDLCSPLREQRYDFERSNEGVRALTGRATVSPA